MAEPMPSKFDALAVWHAERRRGIMHTPEWDATMADLKREFYRWQDAHHG